MTQKENTFLFRVFIIINTTINWSIKEFKGVVMIIRNYLQCDTCRNIFAIRVSVGANEKHLHSFQCLVCDEIIEIVLHLNFTNHAAYLECKDNCHTVDEPANLKNLQVINLHPTTIIPMDKINDIDFSPNIDIAHKIMEKQLELAGGKDLSVKFHQLKDFYNQSNTDLENWKIIKKAWSLLISGKEKLSKEKIKQYKFFNFPGTDKVNEALFHFITLFLSPYKSGLLKELLDKSQLALEDIEYERFMNYYYDNLYELHYRKYYEIISDYFQSYEEFSQVENIVKYDLPYDGIVTSSGFGKIKMFYGNCYELITGLFIILSCINNILSGRPFDKFKEMDLNKYLSINKSGRHKNFIENEIFTQLVLHLRGDLRNASHHQNMVLDGKYIRYRKNGSGTWNKISCGEYMMLCNQIFYDICLLFQYELVITGQ